jgi:3-hydroxyacyl-CoA dehydrogenase/enoyl-CoA hydratase/3-hydroxybutyryl-CoA epimerase
VLEQMVNVEDRAGRRSGRGFYDYSDGKRLWSGLADLFPVREDQPTAAALVERFLYVQAIEAARCVDSGVLRAVEDADVGAILGWGFAPYTGGPLSFVDQVGINEFVARADALTAAHGVRFSPPDNLRRMASEGRGFYA